MWVFTERGFYSVVEKGPKGQVCVRTRVKEDIENLRSYIPEMGQILVNAATDYPYRVFVKRQEWTRALARMSEEIDYPNFKNRVYERQGKDRASLYGRVWSVMYDAERKSSVSRPVNDLYRYLTEPVQQPSADLMEYANDAYYEAEDAPAPKAKKAPKATKKTPKKAAPKTKKPVKKAAAKVSKRK